MHILTFLFLLFCACTVSASNYFVEFGSSKNVRAVSTKLGGTQLGPIGVSKYGHASFGPMTSSLPAHAIVRWETENGESREQVIDFSSKPPLNFNSLKFYLDEDGRLIVSFVVRIGGWRSMEIPLDESTEAAKLRELNESLYIAAGRGEISSVRRAVEAGADVNYLADSIYPSPVRYAANGLHKEVVKYLLSKGARVGKRDMVAPMLSELINDVGRGE